MLLLPGCHRSLWRLVIESEPTKNSFRLKLKLCKCLLALISYKFIRWETKSHMEEGQRCKLESIQCPVYNIYWWKWSMTNVVGLWNISLWQIIFCNSEKLLFELTARSRDCAVQCQPSRLAAFFAIHLCLYVNKAGKILQCLHFKHTQVNTEHLNLFIP